MEIHKLISQAQSGNFGTVHVIAGSERLFIDRAVAALRRAVVGEEGDAFNEEVFQGKGATAQRIVEAARTLPMMAQKRFVLVRGVDQMAASEQDVLAAYLQDPSESTCVVMTAEKLDGRLRFAKQAKKSKALSEAGALKPGALRSFVASEARSRGLKIDERACAELVDSIGNDLPALDDALERLSLYVGEGAPITSEAVQACVSRVRVESIWMLVDAISSRDRRAALTAAASLLSDREPPLRILAMIARQLRMLGRMQAGLKSGMDAQSATRAAGAPPFKARELATAAKRFDAESLASAFLILAETDMALKGSKRPGDAVLEEAILSLTARGQSRTGY